MKKICYFLSIFLNKRQFTPTWLWDFQNFDRFHLNVYGLVVYGLIRLIRVAKLISYFLSVSLIVVQYIRTSNKLSVLAKRF